jgi:hypothetical protein
MISMGPMLSLDRVLDQFLRIEHAWRALLADPGRLRHTLAYLGAAIRLYRDTFRRLGLLGGQAKARSRRARGDGEQPTSMIGERFKVALQLPAATVVWIRARQYGPGPIPRGSAARASNPQDTTPDHQHHGR